MIWPDEVSISVRAEFVEAGDPSKGSGRTVHISQGWINRLTQAATNTELQPLQNKAQRLGGYPPRSERQAMGGTPTLPVSGGFADALPAA